MRQSNQDVEFVQHNNQTIGICLGFDFCAEHEWGIRRLKRDFGLTNETKTWFGKTKPVLGLDARRIRQCNEKYFVWNETKSTAVLMYEPMLFDVYGHEPEKLKKRIKDIVSFSLKFHGDETVAAAWDEKSFGIKVKGSANIQKLRQIYKAFLNKDIAFLFRGKQTPFDNSGLCIVEVSKFPQEFAQQMLKADEDRLELLKAAESIGIEKELQGAEKRWFALSPRWAKDIHGSEDKTKYPVMYWLNPMEQHIHNSGWFTVEDLQMWAQNKGPVMKDSR